MQQEKKESFWAYLFMGFLGGFGAHKFYLRKPYMGVLYMCTGGLLGLGFIYDFFTLPFQVAKSNREIEEEEQLQSIPEPESTEHVRPQRKCGCTCDE